MNAAVNTRQRILESARGLIYSSSYADVGVAAICEHAGVKKGSFYHFFPSKQELTLAVIDEYILDFKQRIISRAFTPDLPPLERFGRLIELAYQFQKDMQNALGHTPGCPFGNLAAEMSTQDEPIRQKVERVFALLESSFAATLYEAGGRGELAADVDVEATAQAMLAYAEGIMLMAKTRNDPEVLRRLGPALAEMRITKSGSNP